MTGELTEWIGYLAGVVTTACYLPQLSKILRTRKASDISLKTYLLLLCGLGLWLAYGILTGNWPVIAANAVSVLFVILILYFRITLKR